VGRWPEKDRIEVSVLLRRSPSARKLPTMAKLGASPIRRRTYLNRAEFACRHSADSNDLETLRRFATENSLVAGDVHGSGRIAKLTGAAADFARAFGVDLQRFDHPSGPYRGYAGSIRLPGNLRGIVSGVFGLDMRPQLRPHFRRNADPAAVGYSIPTVAAAYSFPPGTTGAGQTIGILEFGGGYSPADLGQFFETLGLAVPQISSVSVDGASNAPTGDPSGPDAEVELDIEMAGAVAPEATIVVYFAPNTDQGFVDALTTAIHDTAHSPSIVSISWGGPEENWATQARDAFETIAQDGAVQGVTILAASGDQGASDGERSGTLAVDFPASSPYAIGCGGTRLVLSGSSIASEVVWNDLSEGEGATGGGVSEQFALPSYQDTASVPAAPNGFDGRGVPDVAANADPETGYAVYVDGQSAVFGGTSAVAPLWAALIARLGQSLGKPLGYANPLLYPPNVAQTFREITSGNNDGYSAGPGWNPCTGLGSPDGSRLLSALES